ncbi:hypothetical protein [Mesobacillus maritimus]|uniref:Uncharacterized protein n=1 Tax=Mesobacillus maritimus TaxID=1643336 RepID=A0ABS7KBC9_9BACI|nr:hypothetical protein [Mesobacillus maritimus]MBY0099346.1 hypothetical protein [Mesobacillus maritimus]
MVTTITDLIELIWMDVSTCPVEEKGKAGMSSVPELSEVERKRESRNVQRAQTRVK